MEDTVYKVIIIGSGPAAYTAALYCARASLDPVVVTGIKFGGLLMGTNIVENYPGFPDAVTGPQLMESFHLQAERFGTSFIIDDVTDVITDAKPYKVILFSGQVLFALTVIVATGSSPKWLNAVGETDLRGYGVSTCATCDGSFFRDEDIIVVGGGDSCFTEAIFLTRYAKSVTIVHRRDTFRASKIMIDRAKNHPKIKFKTPYEVKIWKTDFTSKLCGAVLKNTLDYTEEVIDFTGAFICIGHTPNVSFMKGRLELDNNGYIINKIGTATSVNGIFAAGDVADPIYKQCVTACSSGCKAALDCIRYLEEEEI